jgi:hypothetical protein
MALNTSDFTSNGNNLTNSGVGESATTPFAQSAIAAEFVSASSDYLYRSSADLNGLDLTGDLTIECWIYPNSLPASGTWHGYVTRDNVTNERSYWFSVYNNSGTYELRFMASSDGSTLTQKYVTFTGYATGGWIHVAVAYDASAGKCWFYKNGSQLGAEQTGLPNSITDEGSDFRIGVMGVSTPLYFNGSNCSQISTRAFWY